MNHFLRFSIIIALFTVLVSLFSDQALAGTVTYPVETNIFLTSSNITLVVETTSSINAITVNGDNAVVTVASPDSFIIRSNNRYVLNNNAGIATDCQSSYSRLVIKPSSGTEVVTITPSTQVCSIDTPNNNNSNPTSDNSGGSSPSTSCGDVTTSGKPDLFQIQANNKSATLYFSPPNMPYNSFYISYSQKPNMLQYGTKLFQGFSDGVIVYKINDLAPNTQYYFQIRAENGCASGDWGNTMSIKTTKSPTIFKTFYKNILTAISQKIHTFISAKQNKVASPQIMNPSNNGAASNNITPSETTVPTNTTSTNNAVLTPVYAPQSNNPRVSPEPKTPSLVDKVLGFFKKMIGG